jgi:hypothetical protein
MDNVAKNLELKDYAVYFVHDDGDSDWGIVSAYGSYNPGEVIYMGGLRCVIDFEI